MTQKEYEDIYDKFRRTNSRVAVLRAELQAAESSMEEAQREFVEAYRIAQRENLKLKYVYVK